jgi:hypothetical protein
MPGGAPRTSPTRRLREITHDAGGAFSPIEGSHESETVSILKSTRSTGMTSRRSLIVMSGVLLILVAAVAATLYALPTLARHLAIARLEAITKRPVAIDRVDVSR